MFNVADKNYNPFKSIIIRLKLFMEQNNLNEITLLKKLSSKEGLGQYNRVGTSFFA